MRTSIHAYSKDASILTVAAGMQIDVVSDLGDSISLVGNEWHRFARCISDSAKRLPPGYRHPQLAL